jgi:hypothetical protein
VSIGLRDDYWVPARYEDDLARVALEWRRAAGNMNLGYFDITAFVEKVLSKLYTQKGILKIEFFLSVPGGKPAFVTYQPLTLHVDTEIWQLAKMGEPFARHVIAHEVGHIILHDYYARGFSNDSGTNISFDKKENSAEWQANTFADCFLIPDNIVKSFRDVQLLVSECSVPEGTARDRLESVRKSEPKLRTFTGEACPRCNNFTLVRIGLNQKCETCGMIKDDATF